MIEALKYGFCEFTHNPRSAFGAAENFDMVTKNIEFCKVLMLLGIGREISKETIQDLSRQWNERMFVQNVAFVW